MARNHTDRTPVTRIDTVTAAELFPTGVLTLPGPVHISMSSEDGPVLRYGMGPQRRAVQLVTYDGPKPRFVVLQGMRFSGDVGLFLRWCNQQTIEHIDGQRTRTQRGIHVQAVEIGGGRSEQGTLSAPTVYWLTPRDYASDTPEYRQAQHEASKSNNDTGLAITRKLIGLKIQGQIDVLTDLYGGRNVHLLKAQLARLADADHKTIRNIEKTAARKYFDAWSGDDLYKSESSHPSHWDSYPGRATGVKSDRRDARDPVNAALNYLYTYLETATEVTMSLSGLDPAISVGSHGVFGTRRNSGALDLMEPLRPMIDRYVITMFRERRWESADFTNCTDYRPNNAGASGQPGQVLLGKGAVKALLAELPNLYIEAASHAEALLKDLYNPKMRSKPATRITGDNNYQQQQTRKAKAA